MGVAGLGAGGVAVFVTKLEAGPVALLAVGFLFLVVGMSGRLPNRLKIGESEAAWDTEKSKERIRQEAPQVGALLDAGGASLEAISSGTLQSQVRSWMRQQSRRVPSPRRSVGWSRKPDGALFRLKLCLRSDGCI